VKFRLKIPNVCEKLSEKTRGGALTHTVYVTKCTGKLLVIIMFVLLIIVSLLCNSVTDAAR